MPAAAMLTAGPACCERARFSWLLATSLEDTDGQIQADALSTQAAE